MFKQGERLRRAWTSLNFYREYLFGFETLVFATSEILSMHEQLVTLQREIKLEIASYDPFKQRAAGHEIDNCIGLKRLAPHFARCMIGPSALAVTVFLFWSA